MDQNSPFQKIVSLISLTSHMSQYYSLKRSSDHYLCVCMFHTDKDPSLHVYEDHYHCFACGAHGNILTLESHRQGLSVLEAAKYLTEKYSLDIDWNKKKTGPTIQELQERKYLEIYSKVAFFYAENLKMAPQQAFLDYISARGFSSDQMDYWGLGCVSHGRSLWEYAKSSHWNIDDLLTLGILRKSQSGDQIYEFFRDRILIPIRNHQGFVVGFGGRILPVFDKGGKSPKYLNSSESSVFEKSKTLFNFAKARASISKMRTVIIVEGYMDCMALVNRGIENVVAVLGTALTSFHVKDLMRIADRFVFCFDMDAAGLKASLRSYEVAFPMGVGELLFCSFEGAKDPDEYLQKYGKEAFLSRVSSSEPLLEVLVRKNYLEVYSPELQLKKIKEDLFPIIFAHQEKGQREIALKRIAQLLGLSSLESLEAHDHLFLKAEKQKKSPLFVVNKENLFSLSWSVNDWREVRLIFLLFYTDIVYLRNISTEDENWNLFLKFLSEDSRYLIFEIWNLIYAVEVPILSQASLLKDFCLSKELTVVNALVHKDLLLLAECGLDFWNFRFSHKKQVLQLSGAVFSSKHVDAVNMVFLDVEEVYKQGCVVQSFERLWNDLVARSRRLSLLGRMR